MKIEIYTKDACPFCVKSKDYLTSKGLAFDEHHINDGSFTTMMAELTERLGRPPRSVPQIFVDNKAIGSFSELVTWATTLK